MVDSGGAAEKYLLRGDRSRCRDADRLGLAIAPIKIQYHVRLISAKRATAKRKRSNPVIVVLIRTHLLPHAVFASFFVGGVVT